MWHEAGSLGHAGELYVQFCIAVRDSVTWQVHPSAAGISVTLCPEKAAKWTACIDEAIESEVLQPGAASKLAGKLQWAVQHLFYRCAAAL